MADEHFFYISPDNISQNSFSLDDAESHHVSHVLRMNTGDTIWLLDGTGVAYTGKIERKEPRVSGTINETIPNYAEPDVEMHLAIGLLKKDRFELLLEKAVECGAASITPLLLDRCVKKSLNMERSRKIVIAAAKQCGRSRFPTLYEPIGLVDWLEINRSNAVCLNIGDVEKLADWNRTHAPNKIHIIIGPEGDFSANEKRLMKENKIPFLSMGLRRLRAETAAITALNIIEHGRREMVSGRKVTG